MAFKPLTDQNYYIIAKHSGKALGFADGKMSTKLKQFDFDPKNDLQKFTFEPGENFFLLKSPGAPGYYVTMENNSIENEALPILFTRQDHIGSLRFEMIPEKDGYYRIQVQGSKRYLDVKYKSVENGATVIQCELMTSDNQLFKPIPVMNDRIGADTSSYKESSDLLRTVTLGAIGTIPDVGGAFKTVAGFFWEEKDNGAELWDKMIVHIDSRIRAFIDQDITDRLRNRVEGALSLIENLSKISTSQPKGPKLEGILDKMLEVQTDFLNSRSGKAVPYVLAYGTIAIALRHAILVSFEELFLVEPTIEDLEDKTRELNDCIQSYSNYITKIKKKFMDERLNYMVNEVVGPYDMRTRDTYDNWLCRPFKMSSKEEFDTNKYLVAQQKKLISTQYALEVDEFLNTGNFWKLYVARTADGLDKFCEDQAQSIKEAIAEAFKLNDKPHVAIIKEAVDKALKTTTIQMIKAIIVCAGGIALLELSMGIEMNTIEKRLGETIVKAIRRDLKKVIFTKVYQSGYIDAIAKQTGNKSKKVVELGIATKDYCHHKFGPGKGAITRIKLHLSYYLSYSLFRGIEIYYDGVSSGLKGKTGKTVQELILAPGEYISSVSGYADYRSICAISFKSQQGRTIGAGSSNKESYYFIADLPDTLNAKLIGIAGCYEGDAIESLSFTWEYEEID